MSKKFAVSAVDVAEAPPEPDRLMVVTSELLLAINRAVIELKQMPADVPGGPDGKWLTIKKCPPLLDALTGGYLIPLVADVWFSMKPDGVEFRSELDIIQTHLGVKTSSSPSDSR